MKTVVFQVRPTERELSLDRFLAVRLRISRKQAKRLLDERRVFINQKRIWIAHHPVLSGDVVEVVDISPAPAFQFKEIRIVHEDDYVLVVDKPAGLESTGEKGIEGRLRETSHPEAIAVHRLDRETSGCLLFARSSLARDALVRQFEERTVHKIYRALVLGPFPDDLARIDRPVNGLQAITEFRLLRRNEQASLIEARPLTGRTHQIRIHLQYVGHPLVGDKTYATRAIRDDVLRAAPRQMLHAWRIAWRDPATGRTHRVTIRPPSDFETMASMLKLGG